MATKHSIKPLTLTVALLIAGTTFAAERFVVSPTNSQLNISGSQQSVELNSFCSASPSLPTGCESTAMPRCTPISSLATGMELEHRRGCTREPRQGRPMCSRPTGRGTRHWRS